MKSGNIGGVAVDQLKSIIGRVEKLEEEKAGICADIRDVFAEAKGNGFDVKAIRQIIKLRKMNATEREEQETILETYMKALGMLPLFEHEEDEAEEPPATGESDDLYFEAVEVVTRDRKASTSYVQRALKIGYNRAAQMIERMEQEGIVSAADHVGKCEVLREAIA